MRNMGLFTSEGPHRAPAQNWLDRLFNPLCSFLYFCMSISFNTTIAPDKSSQETILSF